MAAGVKVSDGASVAGAGVAGAWVAGVVTAGCSVVVVGTEVASVGVRLPAVSAAETTRAPPAAASEAITRPKAVVNAATGRRRRLKTPWRRFFWASARTSGTRRDARSAGTSGAGLA